MIKIKVQQDAKYCMCTFAENKRWDPWEINTHLV